MSGILFDAIPELSTWIHVEALLSCCQVCKAWNRNLRLSSIVQKRLLIRKWPIVSDLLSIPPDSWAPWYVIDEFRRGAIHVERHLYVYQKVEMYVTLTARSADKIYRDMGYCLWNRISQSTDLRITWGWSHFDNGRAQMSEQLVRRAFQHHGYRIKVETRDCILYQKQKE
jgi:hypothetical protein